MADKQYGLPLIIENFKEGSARGLKRVRLEKGNGDDGYAERWLQKLVGRYPNILPIEQIEPALTEAVSICMELPLPSGFADNLYATPDGDLIVGETKLFRNPEARREVVGQLIDYAKDLASMSYEQLQDAIRRRRTEIIYAPPRHSPLSAARVCGPRPRKEFIMFAFCSPTL